MGEVNWLMVLGGIAIIFPIIIGLMGSYFNEDLTEDFLTYDIDDYNSVANLTCENVFDEGNYELLDEYRYIFFYPENSQWISKFYIKFGCNWLSETYMQDKLNETMLDINQLKEFLTEEEEKSNRLIDRLNPTLFFSNLKTLPVEIKTFIYAFYGLFFGYIIWRTFTIG